MRDLTRVFLCFLATLSLAATCAGQTIKGPGTTRPQPRPSPEKEGEIRAPGIISTGRAARAEERQVGQATVSYSRDENETSVSVGGEVYRKPPVAIWLFCSFSVTGAQVVRPEAVEVSASTNGELVFKEGSRLAIEADGKRFDFDTKQQGCHGRLCIDMNANVDFATFERIANSKSVKVYAGRFAFELNEGARQAFRDVLRTVETPAKKP